MADIDDVLDALVTQCSAALTNAGLGVANTNWFCYKGWPKPEQLDADMNASTPLPHVSVFNSGADKNSTRIPRKFQVQTAASTSLTTSVSNSGRLSGGGVGVAATGTITFGGTTGTGSLVMVTANNILVPGYGLQQGSASYNVPANATLAQVATGVAAAINASSSMSPLVTATAAGAVVTLTAASTGAQNNAMQFAALTGGTATLMAPVNQDEQTFEIHIWTPDNATRKSYAQALRQALALVDFLQYADGSYGRLKYSTSRQNDTEVKHNIYRRILYYSAEYTTTVTATAPQVLDPSYTLQGGVNQQTS